MTLIVLTTTVATLLLNDNQKRKTLKIQMQPSSIDAGNTGQIRITKGHQPGIGATNPSRGEVLIQGGFIDEPKGGTKLDDLSKKAIWATSDTADQSLTVEEESEL